MNNSNKILIPLNNPPKTYLKALRLVGLEPVCKFNPTTLDGISGLLLTGGGDILPSFYGNRVINAREVNPIRDLNEFNLLNYFYRKGLPVLGVCRGLQLINVFFGGTLKNVEGHSGLSGYYVEHEVIPPKSRFLKGIIKVNSFHRQAVDKLCDRASNVCLSADNTVEGFTVGKNIFAVQFHPERMDSSAVLSVYGQFANAVKKKL